VDQLDFLCTPPQAACDASAAPANGASGDCTDSLPNGTTCRPVCDSGFELSGSSSCNNGELAPARCQAATSYVSESLCLDGMAISSWEECKTANANQPSPVPEEAEFADNNWPYGCFTILAQNKLYFNGQIDATATGDEVAREVEFVCTGKTGVFETGGACDASVAPASGTSGNCTDSLPSGSTCQPVCDSGLSLSGPSSCTDGELVPARCQVPPMTVIASEVENSAALTVDWTNVASSPHQSVPLADGTLQGSNGATDGYLPAMAIDGVYVFSVHHAGSINMAATLTIHLGATRNVVAFGAMAAWPMHTPQSIRLTINGLIYKQPWSDYGKKYYLWEFESAVETDEVKVSAVAASGAANNPSGSTLNEVEVWVPTSSLAGEDAKNPWNPLVKATETWNSFYCAKHGENDEVGMRMFEESDMNTGSNSTVKLTSAALAKYDVDQCVMQVEKAGKLQFKIRSVPVCTILRDGYSKDTKTFFAPAFAAGWCLDNAKSAPENVCCGSQHGPNGCPCPESDRHIGSCNIAKWASCRVCTNDIPGCSHQAVQLGGTICEVAKTCLCEGCQDEVQFDKCQDYCGQA